MWRFANRHLQIMMTKQVDAASANNDHLFSDTFQNIDKETFSIAADAAADDDDNDYDGDHRYK
ncbi:hypothetical protein DPMN_057598 [Dreissena polymorpha]|uniref:Uncharacterized protein n=1 Tax=Dreissena polymorpha TaxID=45954 RepID=A0A9D4C091_DREPO|nr:hypothetical protein DPMN_057598 [Dreissena polymorpha]